MVGPIKIIGMLAVFMSLTLALVHTCFGMTGLITDQVLSWIGGHMNSALGARHDQEAGNVFVGAVGNVKSASGSVGNRVVEKMAKPKAGGESVGGGESKLNDQR